MEYNFTSTGVNYDTFEDYNFISNSSAIEQLSLKMHPKNKLYSISKVWTIVLYIAHVAIVAIAVIGNVLVLWLVLASRRMRTVTNTFLCNLAAADIVISVFSVPFHFQAALHQRWDIPHFLCPICPFTQELSVLVSVFTLTAIALQKYGAVVHPLHIGTTRCTPCIVVALIWIAAICIAIPVYVDFGVKIYHNADYSEITPFCQSKHLSKSFKWYYYQCLVFVQYILPLLIISVAYYKTGKHLWSIETPGNNEESRDAIILNNKKKVTKMMVVVVVMFAICWLPYQCYNVLQIYYPSINKFYYINFIWLWIHWLAMSNSCVNPFIYAILSEKFREEFTRRWRHRRGADSEEPTNNEDENIAMVVQNVQILERVEDN